MWLLEQGYVAGPVLYAAAKLKVPTIVHEQNSIPGITNKFLSKYVDRVAVAFEAARPYFPKEKTVLQVTRVPKKLLH